MKNIADVLKLSPRQRDLFDAAQDPRIASGLHGLYGSWRGPLDPAALEQALSALIARQPALRTAFFAQGLNEPVQVVRQQVEPVLERLALDHGELRAALATHFANERLRPLNLSVSPLARFQLLDWEPGNLRVLVLLASPLVCDAASLRLCLSELLALYQAACSARASGLDPKPALAAALPEPSRPFRDHIAWLEQQDLRAAAAYFQVTLGDPSPTPLPFPCAAPVAAMQSLPWQRRVILSSAQTQQIQQGLRQHHIRLSTLLQAAWALILHPPHPGDALFGLSVDGRPANLPHRESMVGAFAGLLPRRIPMPQEERLIAWLKALDADLDRLLQYPQASLSQIRTWTGARVASSPLHSVVAVIPALQQAPAVRLGWQLGGSDFHEIDLTQTHPADIPPPLRITAHLADPIALELQGHAGISLSQLDRLAEGLADLLCRLSAPSAPTLPLLWAQAQAIARSCQTLPGPIPASAELTAYELETLLARHPSVSHVRVRRDPSAGADPEAHPGRYVAEVTLAGNVPQRLRKPLKFSLFYFADANAASSQDKYRLYLEGARFADRHRFEAVWTPERHFHLHGGLYPNPSLLSAALATITEHVQLRAGSVVLPINHPLRVAEDWAIIDNLSQGRVGISVASGWVPGDFVLAPEHYEQRREVMFERLHDVLRLWRGEPLGGKDGLGNDVETHIYPRPLQPTLPIWLTCAGNPETFRDAGKRGFNVLTGLLYQSLEQATEHIALYRQTRAQAGHDPAAGQVTLMLHTFIGRDLDQVHDTIREPLTTYLRAHVSLMEALVRNMNLPFDVRSPELADQVAAFAFERYYRTAALAGTPTSCLAMIDRVRTSDADEIACLIDFGIPTQQVLDALSQLVELKRMVEDERYLTAQVLSEHLANSLPNRPLPPIQYQLHTSDQEDAYV